METFIDFIIWLVFVADIMVILIGYCQEQYSPVMPTGRLQACRNKVKSHITNLELSVFTGKSQTLALPC